MFGKRFWKILFYFFAVVLLLNLVPILVCGTFCWLSFLYSIGFQHGLTENQTVSYQDATYTRQYGQYTTMPPQYAWELAISEKAFLELAQQQDWAVWPITESVKILRYNYGKTQSREAFQKIVKATLQDEVLESPYHFIRHGYFYAFDGDGRFSFSLHVGYDRDNGQMYFYKRARGTGYTFQALNPNHPLPEQPRPFLPSDPFAF